MNVFEVSVETPIGPTHIVNNKYVTLWGWVSGCRETLPGVTGWVKSGPFRRDVFMQWPLRIQLVESARLTDHLIMIVFVFLTVAYLDYRLQSVGLTIWISSHHCKGEATRI